MLWKMTAAVIFFYPSEYITRKATLQREAQYICHNNEQNVSPCFEKWVKNKLGKNKRSYWSYFVKYLKLMNFYCCFVHIPMVNMLNGLLRLSILIFKLHSIPMNNLHNIVAINILLLPFWREYAYMTINVYKPAYTCFRDLFSSELDRKSLLRPH